MPAYGSKSDLKKVLRENIITCFNCSERASEERIDCAPCCRACSALFEAFETILNVGGQEIENELASIVRKSAVRCKDMCKKHDNEHCRRCVDANERLLQVLDKYYPAA